MPAINPIFDTKQKMAWYTAEAKLNERFARQATDEHSRRHFMDKANYWWGLVVELRGA